MFEEPSSETDEAEEGVLECGGEDDDREDDGAEMGGLPLEEGSGEAAS
jgi:hypothetical protein